MWKSAWKGITNKSSPKASFTMSMMILTRSL